MSSMLMCREGEEVGKVHMWNSLLYNIGPILKVLLLLYM